MENSSTSAIKNFNRLLNSSILFVLVSSFILSILLSKYNINFDKAIYRYIGFFPEQFMPIKFFSYTYPYMAIINISTLYFLLYYYLNLRSIYPLYVATDPRRFFNQLWVVIVLLLFRFVGEYNFFAMPEVDNTQQADATVFHFSFIPIAFCIMHVVLIMALLNVYLSVTVQNSDN